MKAIQQTGYGNSDVLQIVDLDRPVPDDDEVLVRMHVAGLHAGDAYILAGSPYIVRFTVGFPKPKNYTPGYDIAGVVEGVGRNVTRFAPGQEVFGGCEGGCAEYVCVKESHLVPKPDSVRFVEAGCVPTSALAALHGLRDAGKLRSDQQVLINGASGGVGTFAIQIAKAFGAEVTAVCGTRNLELVRSLGADHAIDYTHDDFTEGDTKYDLILDNVASRSFADCRRVLTPDGKLIPNSGMAGLGYIAKAAMRAPFYRQQGMPYYSSPNHDDLMLLKQWLETGQIRPVIDRTFPFEEVPAALDYVSQGHVNGKVVITMDGVE